MVALAAQRGTQMRVYIAKRAVLAVPTLLLVSVVVFSLMHLIPGDAVIARLQEIGGVTDETINAVRHELGLDKPFYQQMRDWFWGLMRGDLGQSLWTREPVADRLVAAIPISAELALGGLTLAVLIAVPLGVLSAIRQDTWMDYLARVFVIFGISLPDFWVGTLLILYLSLWFGFLPPLGYTSLFDDPMRNLQQFLLPVLVLGLRLSATTARMVRATMLEALRQDYIRTARQGPAGNLRGVSACAEECGDPRSDHPGYPVEYAPGGDSHSGDSLFSSRCWLSDVLLDRVPRLSANTGQRPVPLCGLGRREFAGGHFVCMA